jgi:putative acetyltransferase
MSDAAKGRLRAADPSDAAALARVFFRAIHIGAASAYDDAQRNAWCPAMPPTERFGDRLRDGRRTWVWVMPFNGEEQPVAFIDLQSKGDGLGHIDMLFCDPDVAGQGIASRLFTYLEQFARELRLTCLRVEASELAAPLFKSRGFVVLERQHIRRNDVNLHNYRMEKHL